MYNALDPKNKLHIIHPDPIKAPLGIHVIPSLRDVGIVYSLDNCYTTDFDIIHDYHVAYLTAYKEYKASLNPHPEKRS